MEKWRVEISYCSQCHWLLRAAWIAHELLVTFDQEILSLTLKLGSGGIFEIRANDELIWDRKAQGDFPEISELKQLVRDQVAPGKDLGHSDRIGKNNQTYRGSDESRIRLSCMTPVRKLMPFKTAPP
jgi:selenoprotein W-related protein